MQESCAGQHCKYTALLYYGQGARWVEQKVVQGMEELDEKLSMESITDWFVWMTLMGKQDVVEELVESMEDWCFLQHEGKQSWDHKMGHANLVEKVGRTEIGVATVSMVYKYSMIACESKEMEGQSFESYMQAMVVVMKLLQLLDLFDILLLSWVRRGNDLLNDSSHICQKL